MRRRSAVLLLIVVAFGLLWRPVLYPGGKAALLLLDLYSPSLVGTDIAGRITPEPIVSDTRGTYGGLTMRVSWWRPAWGPSHPGILIVNGATPAGNDDAVTRSFGASLARAGYLVMLPELPFLKQGQLDVKAKGAIDDAFAALRADPETAGRPVGMFAASVGAGLALVAAGSGGAAAHADYVVVLGSYFDVDTYIASVSGRAQRRGGRLVPWHADDEVEQRLPPAVIAAMPDEADANVVAAAFAIKSYPAALALLRTLSSPGRAVLNALSPRTVWANVSAPVFWIHDPHDAFEPPAQAHEAAAAPRIGRLELVMPDLVQHAEVSPGVGAESRLKLAGQLWGLLTFALDALRIAG